jgi:hypothetical protein
MHQPFLKNYNKSFVLLLIIELCLLSAFGLLTSSLNPRGEASQISPVAAPVSDVPVYQDHLYFKGLPQEALEIVEERTHSSKTFLLPDGRKQVIVSSGEFHYNDHGSWKDIDTRWQPYSLPRVDSSMDASIWDYQMVAAAYQAYVRKEFGAHDVVALSKQGHVLRMAPGALSVREAFKTVAVISAPRDVPGEVTNKPFDIISGGGYIEWKGAYGEGLDFRYTPSDTRFIKILEIASPGALKMDACEEGQSCVLQLDLDFETDLDLYVGGQKWDGKEPVSTAYVEFKDHEGQTQWWWKNPVATGADGDTVVGRFLIRPSEPASQAGLPGNPFTVSVQFPLAWFREAEFPVRIDPDTFYGVAGDGYITGQNSAYGQARNTSSSSDNSGATLLVGQDYTTVYQIHRSFVAFDTSVLSSTPARAHLYLKASADNSSTDFTVRIHQYSWSAPLSSYRETNYDGALASTYDADWRGTSGLSIGVYYSSQSLSAAYISTTGSTYYALLSDQDVVGTEPTGGEYLNIYSQDAASAIDRPYLSIEPVVEVYYSAGTDTGDLKSGSPNVTVTNHTAVFTVAQPDNVGVGDEILAGGNTYYIQSRQSSTAYTVTTATGAIPSDLSSTAVTSISRAFNTLSDAESNSSGASYLNNSDLTSSGADVQLNWALYKDGAFNGGDGSGARLTIDGYTTDSTHYIRMFAPSGTTEVGASQRHTGTEGTGVVIRPTNSSPGADYSIFSVGDLDLRLEGLEFDGSNITNAEVLQGISVNDGQAGAAGTEVWIDSVIVHDLTNSTVDENDESDVRGISFIWLDTAKVRNTLVYDLENVSTNAQSDLEGIRAGVNTASATRYLYNVSVYDLTDAGSRYVHGIDLWQTPTAVIYNTFCGKIQSAAGAEACFYADVPANMTQAYNVSSDATASGTGSQTGKTNYTEYFYEPSGTSTDLHLRHNSSTLWGGNGADLDSDANLPVTEDIDGDARHATAPDIGADEVTNEAASAPLTPNCEGAVTPVSGVTDTTPEFSAVCDDPDTNNCTNYEIEVNTASDFTGTVMWDTGKTSLGSELIENTRMNDVSYAGTALVLNGATYYWRIRFWDTAHDGGSGEADVAGDWSAVQTFSMDRFLTFTLEPTTSFSCQLLENQPVVATSDAVSDVDVTIAILSNPGSSSLLGTTTVTTNGSGVATFTDLQIPVPGVGYTLRATATGYTADTTAAFTVESCTTPMSSVVYNNSTGDLYVKCWLEGAEGRVTLGASDTCAVNIYEPDGSLEKAISTGDFGAPSGNVFSYDWSVDNPDFDSSYFAEVSLYYDSRGQTYVSFATYDLTQFAILQDVNNILVDTSAINWTNVTDIKAKTDTINWTDITEIKAKTDTIEWSDIGVLMSDVSALSAASTSLADVNWDDMTVMTTRHINWTNVYAMAAAQINWIDMSVQSKAGVNWENLEFMSEAGVNWYDIAYMSGAGVNWTETINWDNLAELTTADVNWDDLTIMSESHLNWDDIGVMTKTNINWYDFRVLSTAGINWRDIDVLSDAGINWRDIDVLSDQGINWRDLDVMSDRGINWRDLGVLSNAGINWRDLDVLSDRGINWTAFNDLSTAGVNWDDIAELTRAGVNWTGVDDLASAGVNWKDVAILSSSGINWISINDLSDAGINWADLDVMSDTGVNWADFSVFTRAGVNWYDMAELSSADINWAGIDSLATAGVNWLDLAVMSAAGVNWTSIDDLSTAGINWLDIDVLSDAGINWSGIDVLSDSHVNWTNLSDMTAADINWMELEGMAVDIQGVNWVSMRDMTKSGINWDSIADMSDAGVNWVALEEISTSGVNWTGLADMANSNINWMNISEMSSSGINWNQLEEMAIDVQGVNWDSLQDMTTAGINWDNFADLSSAGINWGHLETMAIDIHGVNWDNIREMTDANVNWEDIKGLSEAGINWLDIDVLSDTGINWKDINIMSGAGINWADLNILSDAGINWQDMDILSDTVINWAGWDTITSAGVNWEDIARMSDAGINWLDVDVLSETGINWDEVGVMTAKGINWTSINDLSDAGINWLDIDVMSDAGVNWLDWDVLSDRGVNWTSFSDLTSAGFNWLDIDDMSDAGINWLDVDVLSDTGVNWLDVDVMSSQGINWLSIDSLSKTGINWIDIDVMSDQGVNWMSMSLMSNAGVNWRDIDILSDMGVNWKDLDVLSDVGINWRDIDVMSDRGINWRDIDVMSDRGINWADMDVISDTGVNWRDIDVMSDRGINWRDIDVMSDRGINWLDIDVMSEQGVNWTSLGVMSVSGINWWDIGVLSSAGINWADVDVLSDTGVNWLDIDVLSSVG